MQGANISGTGIIADLARINIKYLLEHYQDGSLKKAVALPLPPKAFSVSQEAPSQITYTLDGGSVRELGRYKSRVITLIGSSGYDARQGYDREGAIIFNTGAFILREFRAFLEEYQETAEENTHALDGVARNELIFRAIDEDYHFKVEVVSFDFQRDSEGAHFAPDWILTLKAYDDAEEVLAFQSVQDEINNIRENIEAVGNGLAVISTTIEGGVGLFNLVLSPLDSLKTSVQALTSITDSLRTVLDLPSDTISRLEQTALTLRTGLTRLINDVERFPNVLSTRFNALRTSLFGTDDLQAIAESLATYAMPLFNEDLNIPNLYLRRGAELITREASRQASQVYRLRLGEDLNVLAQRFLGDASRWTELAYLNGWVDVDRLANGRIAELGDIIFIPIENNDIVNLSFGEDLLLNDEGELVIENNDLVTVQGSKNLEQGLKLRMKAVQGETPIFKNYGLPITIGRRLTPSFSGYIGSIMRAQLNKDLRVDRVLFIELLDNSDTLQAHIELRANEINNLGLDIVL